MGKGHGVQPPPARGFSMIQMKHPDMYLSILLAFHLNHRKKWIQGYFFNLKMGDFFQSEKSGLPDNEH